MKFLKIFTFIFIFSIFPIYGEDTPLTLSIITVRAGDKIYTTFGHTGIRIQDNKKNKDYLFNYGTFDFDTQGFVYRFVKGLLNYSLDIQNFKSQYRYYTKKQDRTVIEQVLNLNQDEINKIYDYLTDNALPENKYYKYDFIKNNCSSKIRYALNIPLEDALIPGDKSAENISQQSYRQFIRRYLGNSPWFDIGIQLALGSVIDKKVTELDSFFLPDLVVKRLEDCTLEDGRPLVKDTITLHYGQNPAEQKPVFFNIPFFIFFMLFILELHIIFKKFPVRLGKILEFSAVFINTLLGILIFYLWFISDHTSTVNNYNILWCSPINIFFLISYFLKNKTVLHIFSAFQSLFCLVYLMALASGLQTSCSSLAMATIFYTAIFLRNTFFTDLSGEP